MDSEIRKTYFCCPNGNKKNAAGNETEVCSTSSG